MESFFVLGVAGCPANFFYLTALTHINGIGGVVGVEGELGVGGAAAVVVAVVSFVGEAAQGVVGETEPLSFGIYLVDEVACDIVAVAPTAHIGIGHAGFAPQAVITHGGLPQNVASCGVGAGVAIAGNNFGQIS